MRPSDAKRKYSLCQRRPVESGYLNFNAGEKKTAGSCALLSGFTLVELLVVILVSVLVTGAAFSIYRTSSQYYVQQDALLEQNQNLRVALYTVARDVRMAGNCFSLLGPFVSTIQVYSPAVKGAEGGWFKYDNDDVKGYGIRAVFGEDGGAGGPDTLTIFRADVESGTEIGTLAAGFSPGSSNSIQLVDNFTQNALKQGDIVALVSGQAAMITEVDNFSETGATELFIPEKARFKPADSMKTPHSGFNFPAGSQVYNLRDVVAVTYYVDTATNCLMANYHDSGISAFDKEASVIVATNIEDFQVRYVLGADPLPVNATSGDETWKQGSDQVTENNLTRTGPIRVVNLAMTAVSSRAVAGMGGSTPVELFNHKPNRPADKYQRRVMTETVFLRNF